MAEHRLELLGDICAPGPRTRMLDLASGKGELVCRFAARFGCRGIGIDAHPPFVEAARRRAAELGVATIVDFLEGDAAAPSVEGRFDVVSCLGATWIGGGLAGTLELMARFLEGDGHLLVGEPYFVEEPPRAYRAEFEAQQTFADLVGTLDRFTAAGLELVEMTLASLEEWDRYSASQWKNVTDWLSSHPDDPDAAGFRSELEHGRRSYLADGRRCLGWGVFVLRPALSARPPRVP